MNIYIASKKTTKRGRVTISLKFKMDGRIFDWWTCHYLFQMDGRIYVLLTCPISTDERNMKI